MARPRKKPEASLTLFSFQDIMCCLVGVMVLVSLLLAVDGLRAEESVAAARKTDEGAEATAVEAAAQLEDLRAELDQLKQQLELRQNGSPVTEQEVQLLERRVTELSQERAQLTERLRLLTEDIARSEAAAAGRAAQLAALRQDVVNAKLQARRERVRMRPGAQGALTPFFVEVSKDSLRIGQLDASQAPVLDTTLPPGASPGELQVALGPRNAVTHYAILVVHADSIATFEALRDALYRKGYQVGWQLWDGSAGAFLERAPTAAEVLP